MFQDILAAIPLGILMAFMFGPVFFVLLETAVVKGARAAIIFDIGVILADATFVLIAYFSTSKLLNSIKDEPGLFIFGGGVLATYGVITFIQHKRKFNRPEPPKIDRKKKGWLKQFAKGYALNFINIGVLGFWLGIIIAFGPTMDMVPQRLFLFFIIVLLTYFLVDLVKIVLAKKLERKLTPNRIYKLKRVISILILLCGVVLIARGIFPIRMKKVQKKMEKVMPNVGTDVHMLTSHSATKE